MPPQNSGKHFIAFIPSYASGFADNRLFTVASFRLCLVLLRSMWRYLLVFFVRVKMQDVCVNVTNIDSRHGWRNLANALQSQVRGYCLGLAGIEGCVLH